MISGDKTKISEQNVRVKNQAGANETRNAEGKTFGSRGIRCPFCGTTVETYYKTGLFGCPECYRYLFPAVKRAYMPCRATNRMRGNRRRISLRVRARRAAGRKINMPRSAREARDMPEYLQKTVTSTRIRLARNLRGYFFRICSPRIRRKRSLRQCGRR